MKKDNPKNYTLEETMALFKASRIIYRQASDTYHYCLDNLNLKPIHHELPTHVEVEPWFCGREKDRLIAELRIEYPSLDENAPDEKIVITYNFKINMVAEEIEILRRHCSVE